MTILSLADVELHSFHWDNFNPDILASHKKLMAFYGLNVQYTQENIPHGEWLTQVVSQSTKKVIGIIEPDVIPLTPDIVLQTAQYVYEYDTFVGCAQVSNHKHPASHIFASPAFFFITPPCYAKLGKPSFMPTHRADVAEELSYKAEEIGIRYRTLYPTYYEASPPNGVWLLGSYGYYGIGTVFHDSVYHLFQSRNAKNVELFVKRVDEVINQTFSTTNFHCSTSFNTPEKMVKPPKKRVWYKNFISKLKGK